MGQRIANGSRGSPAGSNIEAVQHYAGLAAKTSGKHIKSLGEAGYKYLSAQASSSAVLINTLVLSIHLTKTRLSINTQIT